MVSKAWMCVQNIWGVVYLVFVICVLGGMFRILIEFYL